MKKNIHTQELRINITTAEKIADIYVIHVGSKQKLMMPANNTGWPKKNATILIRNFNDILD